MKELYYRTMGHLENGKLIINGKAVDMPFPLASFVSKIGDFPTIKTSSDVANFLLTQMIKKFPLWDTRLDPVTKLLNLNWFRLLLVELGTSSKVLFPSYEQMMEEEFLDLCIITLAEPLNELYLDILDTTVTPIIKFISMYKHTVMNGSRVEAPDGRYYDIVTHEVQPSTYTHTIWEQTGPLTVDGVLGLQSSEMTGSDRLYDLVLLLSAFNTAVRENTVASEFNEFIKLLNYDKLLKLDEYGDLDIQEIKMYLETLLSTITSFLECTRKEIYPDTELFEIAVQYYSEIETHVPDITMINHARGLIIHIQRDVISGYVTYYNGDKVNIFKALDYDKVDNSLIIEVIHNLYYDQETDMGRLIIDMLKRVGLKDLYLQAPPKFKG